GAKGGDLATIGQGGVVGVEAAGEASRRGGEAGRREESRVVGHADVERGDRVAVDRRRAQRDRDTGRRRRGADRRSRAAGQTPQGEAGQGRSGEGELGAGRIVVAAGAAVVVAVEQNAGQVLQTVRGAADDQVVRVDSECTAALDEVELLVR